MTDESGQTSYRYDARGNMVETTQTTGSESYTTAYAYDLADNVVQIEYPSGMLVELVRGASGRVEEVTAQADPLSPVDTIVTNVAWPRCFMRYPTGKRSS
ncbi:MAG TPA: RHS repeat domain-containing protein [Terriglobales bacterium]|nr:RHS repeat domain-containing protein [Terriglobales bacterium]